MQSETARKTACARACSLSKQSGERKAKRIEERIILPLRGASLLHPYPAGRCPGLAYRSPFGAPPFPCCLVLTCFWPFFLHFVLKASKFERRPCYPFVQADMLSACIEYEDILSDKQRGAHPSPPKGRELTPTPNPIPEQSSPTRSLSPREGGQGTSTYTSNRLTSNGRFSPSLGEGTGVGFHSPLPWRLHRRVLRIKNPHIQLRRIAYPPEHGGRVRGGLFPLSLGEGTGVGTSSGG